MNIPLATMYEIRDELREQLADLRAEIAREETRPWHGRECQHCAEKASARRMKRATLEAQLGELKIRIRNARFAANVAARP